MDIDFKPSLPRDLRSAEQAPDDEGAGFDPFNFVRRCLRGRWAWVVILGLLCGAGGVFAGWRAEQPLYKSEGLLRIAYALPPVIRETDQNQPMAMFESFLRSQQLRLSSRTMIEASLKRVRGATPGVVEVADFASRLTVEHPAGTEHLRVSVTDEDPVHASLLLNALINTYSDAYEQQDKKVQDQRMEVLEQHRLKTRNELNTVEHQAEGDVAVDTVLRDFVSQEADLERQLQRLRQSGYGESHDRVVDVKTALDRVRGQIRQYAADMQGVSPGSSTTDPAANSQSPFSVDGQMARLGAKHMELQRLEEEGAQLRLELEETSARIESLEMESTVGGRLDVISPGDVPVQPFRDRRKYFAAAGGMAGACIPAALLVLLALARPRYRFSDETETDLGPAGQLLGILPLLSEQMNDPDRAIGAAQCVHQMRVMLQVSSTGKASRYLVTSACPGEGKTSLTLALGLSFSAAGCRTLVIDADLAGRRLTHGFGADDEPGFFEALSAPMLAPYIRQTAPGLWIMPSGRAGPLHAGRVSGAATKALLNAAHAQFDIVLVDSGPVLGSIEASVIAPQVDGVIVTVSRGQQPSLVNKTLSHVRAIGAKSVGYVFNKARSRDFFRSSLSSIARPMSSREMAARVLSTESDGLLRFGPLVKAVMSSLPAPELEELESFHQQTAPLLG